MLKEDSIAGPKHRRATLRGIPNESHPRRKMIPTLVDAGAAIRAVQGVTGKIQTRGRLHKYFAPDPLQESVHVEMFILPGWPQNSLLRREVGLPAQAIAQRQSWLYFPAILRVQAKVILFKFGVSGGALGQAGDLTGHEIRQP